MMPNEFLILTPLPPPPPNWISLWGVWGGQKFCGLEI